MGAWPTASPFSSCVVVSLLAKLTVSPVSAVKRVSALFKYNRCVIAAVTNVPAFPVTMDEEYYSGSGDWEGTEGSMVRSRLVAVWLSVS